jgi:hypothetical protein
MLSILLDIEWLLSTLFDASLLTFEPPETAAPFFCRPASGPVGPVSIAPSFIRPVPVKAGRRRYRLRDAGANKPHCDTVKCCKALILLVV